MVVKRGAGLLQSQHCEASGSGEEGSMPWCTCSSVDSMGGELLSVRFVIAQKNAQTIAAAAQ